MIKYIVVSENNRWGADEDLQQAFKNVDLKVWTAADHFCSNLEASFHNEDPVAGMAEAMKDWKEYAKEETEECYNDPMACFVYRFNDEEIWDSWEVSPFHGGVTFKIMEGTGLSQQQVDDMFKACVVKVTWLNGVITPWVEDS
jgi:hypothetical protein